MAWIKSHQELARHPKTKKLARLLGVNIPQAIGHLHLLWWYAIDYVSEGDLTPFDTQEIADAAGWEGDAQTFVTALIEAKGPSGHGFLDNGADLRIHDWDEHAGKLLDMRQKNAARMKEARAKNVTNTFNARTGARVDKSRVEKNILVAPPEAVRLAELLFSLIRLNNPKAKEPNIQAWAKDIDRMIRLDGRDPQEIEGVIHWCQADDFWYSNILSAKKLREQYDQLYVKMGKGTKKKGCSLSDPANRYAYWDKHLEDCGCEACAALLKKRDEQGKNKR